MAVALGTNIANPISTALSQWPGFDMMGKLANYGKLGATDPDAVIEALFAAGEQGAWYDPSDLSTMFQDRAGTTPVTADGQTVGLILDKSKGLVLGSELVTNGDFSSATGWSVTATGVVIGSGVATATASGPGYLYRLGNSIVAGRTYEVSFDVSGYSGTATIRGYIQASPVFGTYVSGNGHFAHRITATATNVNSECGLNMSAGFNGVIDNFSVKAITGNHAVAPSDAARPLKTSTGTADWINYDAVDDVLNSTFPSSLGSSCTVCRANVGSAPTILTAQTIGTSYADSTDHAGLIIINRDLTAQETTDVTAWLTAKGAT